MNNTRLALVLLASALALSACGNKGPLVLPDKPDTTTTPAAETVPAEATDTVPASDTPPVTEPQQDAGTPATPEPLPQDDND